MKHTLTTNANVEQSDGNSVEVEVTYDFYPYRPQRLNEPAEPASVTITWVEPEVGDEHAEALEAACWEDLSERFL